MTRFILPDFRFNFEQKNTSNVNYVLFDKVKSTRDFNLLHKYKRSHTQKVTNSVVVNNLTDIDWTLNGTRHICIIKLEVLKCFDVSICEIRLGYLSLLLQTTCTAFKLFIIVLLLLLIIMPRWNKIKTRGDELYFRG